ncbi:hypothetical protein GJ496_001282 [Pomphorhynchus laevis]|nr:hypothetical protein GJ496_001282 [Pomphorhynchus laevis]
MPINKSDSLLPEKQYKRLIVLWLYRLSAFVNVCMFILSLLVLYEGIILRYSSPVYHGARSILRYSLRPQILRFWMKLLLIWPGLLIAFGTIQMFLSAVCIHGSLKNSRLCINLFCSIVHLLLCASLLGIMIFSQVALRKLKSVAHSAKGKIMAEIFLLKTISNSKECTNLQNCRVKFEDALIRHYLVMWKGSILLGISMLSFLLVIVLICLTGCGNKSKNNKSIDGYTPVLTEQHDNNLELTDINGGETQLTETSA